MNSTKRNAYMDFLKGTAIVAMVMGHYISVIPKGETLCNVIYSFHMPLLMFVSAYVEEQNREKYAAAEWKMPLKRACGLLIPYISWSLLYGIISGQIWNINIENFLLQLSGYRQTALWFFPVLFGLKILHCFYWYLQKTIRNKHCCIRDILIFCFLEFMTVGLAVLTRQPYIISMISYAIPYFFAVSIVDNEVFRKIINSEWVIAGAFLVYLFLFPYFSFDNTHWSTQVIKIGLSLCVIIICCKYQEKWELNRFHKILCLFGEESLAIYVLHKFFIDSELYLNMTESVYMVASGLSAFVISGICIGIARIIAVSSWWRKILLGK